jgi:hypothetical protein
MNYKLILPTQDINCYYTIDRMKKGHIRIELEKCWGNQKYIKQYITYLVLSGFIEVGDLRTMGDLTYYKHPLNKKMVIETMYGVCKELSEDGNDDVWVEGITKTFTK